MKLAQILARIDVLRKAKGWSDNKLSEKAGKPDAIRNMRRAVKEGRRGVNAQTLAALEEALEVAPGSLQTDERDASDIQKLHAELDSLVKQRDRLNSRIEGMVHAISVLESPGQKDKAG